MKKLLIVLAALCALILPGAAEAAHPCLQPGAGYAPTTCLHWPDTNRANETAYWNDLYNETGIQDWNDQHYNAMVEWSQWTNYATWSWHQPGACPAGNAPMDGQPMGGWPSTYAYPATRTCVRNYTNTECWGAAAEQWAGCTTHWARYEWINGSWQISPHFAFTEIAIDAAVGGWGANFWASNNRRMVSCHEIGHSLGGNHTASDPWNQESCLYYGIPPWNDPGGISTYGSGARYTFNIGPHVRDATNAYMNHNDPAVYYLWNGQALVQGDAAKVVVTMKAPKVKPWELKRPTVFVRPMGGHAVEIATAFDLLPSFRLSHAGIVPRDLATVPHDHSSHPH